MRRWIVLGPALAVLALGCAASESDDIVTKTPKLSQIKTDILEKNCTFACHSGGEFAAGGLDLDVDPYGALVNVAPTADACSGSAMKRIAPGDPESSLLYLLVTAKTHGGAAPCGDAMPQGADRAALSAADSETIRAWIAAGAKND